MNDREQERADVVAWLRSLKDAPGLPAFGFKPHHLQVQYSAAFADAIERGEHIKETRNDG